MSLDYSKRIECTRDYMGLNSLQGIEFYTIAKNVLPNRQTLHSWHTKDFSIRGPNFIRIALYTNKYIIPSSSFLLTFPEDNKLEGAFFFRLPMHGELMMDQDPGKAFHLK